MREATLSRDEMLRRLDTEYNRLNAALARLTPEQSGAPNVVGTWSIKDVLAHLIHWTRFPVGEVKAALVGDTYIYDDRGDDEINNANVARYADKSLDEVVEQFDTAYGDLLDFLISLPDSAFEQGNSLEETLDESLHGIFANNTYEHYPIHEAQIREYADRLGR